MMFEAITCVMAHLEPGDLVAARMGLRRFDDDGSEPLIFIRWFTGDLDQPHVRYEFIAPDGKQVILHAWSHIYVLSRMAEALG